MSGWMIALIAVGGVLLLLLLILFCGMARLRITCRDEVRVSARVLGLHFRLYPTAERDGTPRHFCRDPDRVLARELRRQKREAKRAEKQRRKKRERAQKQTASPKLGLLDKLSMIRALTKDLFELSRGKIRIRTLRLHIVVATDDAAKTALLWGGVSSSASLLLDWINEHYAPIEHEQGEIDIRPDFVGSCSGANIDLVFSVSLFSILRIALGLRSRYGEERTKAQMRAIRRKNRKKRAASAK